MNKEALRNIKENEKIQQAHLQAVPLDDDEIDLLALFRTLWNGKWIILGFALFFSLIAAGKVFTDQQWWTAKAVVVEPNLNQVMALTLLAARYESAFDKKSQDPDNEKTEGMDRFSDLNWMFSKYIEKFNSSTNKNDFLNTNIYFIEAQKTLGEGVYKKGNIIDTARSERINRDKWLDRITAKSINKENINEMTLSVKSISEGNSFDLLIDYLNFTNETLKQDLLDDLNATLDIKRQQLDQQLQSRLLFVEQNIKLEIARSEYALQIASAANIKRPLENWNKNELFPIELGSDGLKAKIEVLKSVDNLWTMDPSIELIANKMALLNQPIAQINKVQFFKYITKAEKAIDNDNITPILIVALAMLLGGFISMCVVFLRSGFSPDNKKFI